MKKRGYILSDFEELVINSSPEESMHYFLKFYLEKAQSAKLVIESQLNAVYYHRKFSKNTVRVIYIETSPDDNQIKKDKSEQILSTIQDDPGNNHFILISSIKFTAATFKDLSDLNTGIVASSDENIARYWIEFFLHEELLYDPTVHVLLQPSYELLSVKDSKAYLAKIKKDSNKLLNFRIDDPSIKFLGGRAGQIVRLVRRLPYISQVSEDLVHRIIINETIRVDPKKK